MTEINDRKPRPRPLTDGRDPRFAGPAILFLIRCLIVLMVSGAAVIMAAAEVWGFGLYGYGLFLGIPATVGFVSVMLLGSHESTGALRAVLISLSAICVAAAVMVVVGFEGAICLIMAAPLCLPAAILGGLIGCVVVQWVYDMSRIPIVLLAGVILPLASGAEYMTDPQAPVFRVSTEIIVEAPIERVWDAVVRFDPLPEPDEWLFRAGVAYPIRAEIDGAGVGATRYCVFSTGPFVEPITVWDEPHHLAFDVVRNPPPMRELTPYDSIDPPHLTDHLVSRRGEFRLERLDADTTRIIGTTWYEHNLWPAWYWRLWSDHIIHRIHERVLEHIRATAETRPEPSRAVETTPPSDQ